LADVFIPEGTGEQRESFARLQRAAATPEVAATILARTYETDVLSLLDQVRAETVIFHRRGDRAIPFS
jgi:hypothetical protein